MTLFQVPEIVFYPGHSSNEISGIDPESTEKSLGVAYAELEMECVTEEDAGIYTCVANQEDKSQTVETEVHVVSKSHLILSQSLNFSKKIPHVLILN